MTRDFAERLDLSGPCLRRQIERLYEAVADIDPLHARAVAIMTACADARSTALRELDVARCDDPDWFVAPDMIGYSTYVDRFGGTVDGVAAHVDHLEALGVRYLHLT